MNNLKQQLVELEKMPLTKLRSRWREIMRIPAPDVGPDPMRRAIANRLQERVHGKLSLVMHKKIESLGRELERRGAIGTASSTLKPGTRLTRSWHGVVHQVLVCDDGFEHEGRRYRSLSQIARAITGAHWSGPRFFGLVSRSKSNA